MQPRSPVSPGGIPESPRGVQCSPHSLSRGRGHHGAPDSPFTGGTAAPDSLPRGASRPAYAGGSPTAAHPLPPPSPSSRKGAGAVAAARGIDALLLNNGQPAPAAQGVGAADARGGSSGSHYTSPGAALRQLDLRQGHRSLDPARTDSAAVATVPHPRDAAAIWAAAAELADRIAADQSAAAAEPPRFSQLRAVTPQPPASTAQQDSNVLALKLTVVAGPSVDTSYITATHTRQVRPQRQRAGKASGA